MSSHPSQPLPGGLTLLLISTALLASGMLWALGGESDYTVHAREAEHWARHGTTRIPLPNFLFAGLTALLHLAVPGLSSLNAAFGVSLFAQLLLATLLYSLLEQSRTRAHGLRAPLVIAGLTLSLMLVMPVNLFTAGDRNLYHGYVAISAHHSPSMALLKPLALWVFIAACRSLEPGAHVGLGRIMGTAAIVILATLAKPSYTIALLPALCAAVFLTRRSKPLPDLRALGMGIAFPACAVLAWQYLYTYSAGQAAHPSHTPSSIEWAPLAVMGTLSPDHLAIKYAMSILFPALVLGAWWSETRRSRSLILAWSTFVVGSLYAYLLAETGPRNLDGNFLWSAQIALFLLFVCSLRFLMDKAALPDVSAPGTRIRVRVCGGAFALHLASGLFWYAVPLAHRMDPTFPLLREWF
ncbi:hypothetical protein MK489_20090 [Myxococcota bacterium]|nr:hypothetical protein [Myxococcota bacterium]